MKKIIAIMIVLILAITLLGCTSPPDANDTNTAEFTVNSQAEADQTLNDVSTDLSGISNSLDDIDNTLTQ